MSIKSLERVYQLGIASTYGHHGELIQGVFKNEDGKLVNGLVTLPYKNAKSKAEFYCDNSYSIKLLDGTKKKAKKAAELTGKYLTGKVIGGTLSIENETPIGKGLGSSTTDVVCTIKAVAESLGYILSNNEVAMLAVKAETASDSIMFSDNAVLFAQRHGTVIKNFGKVLPNMYVLGIEVDHSKVDTLSIEPPIYSEEEIILFSMLLKLLENGIRNQDVSLIGKVATTSSIINQKYLPKPNLTNLIRIVYKNKVAGIQVAHSGTVVGIIFDPKEPNFISKVDAIRKDLNSLGLESYEFII